MKMPSTLTHYVLGHATELGLKFRWKVERAGVQTDKLKENLVDLEDIARRGNMQLTVTRRFHTDSPPAAFLTDEWPADAVLQTEFIEITRNDKPVYGLTLYHPNNGTGQRWGDKRSVSPVLSAAAAVAYHFGTPPSRSAA